MLNAAATAVQTANQIGIFYASQTGNGETIARRLAQDILAAGRSAEIKSFLELKPSRLKNLSHAVFVISTHGDGDPPDDALDLFEYLAGARAPQLSGLQFRVLALGDSSYLQFCEAGRQLEKHLLANGAAAFSDRVECDLDYQADTDRFCSEILEFCQQELEPGAPPAPTPTPLSATPHLSVVPDTPVWNREKPFPATVESVNRITTPDSAKDVRHVTLSLAGSGLSYQPGDSLAVRAFNDPELVDELLQQLRLDPAQRVSRDGRSRTLREWLTRHFELTRLSPDTVRSWADLVTGPELPILLKKFDEGQLRSFIEQRQLIDLAIDFPGRIDGQTLVDILRPLTTRSYSIASSQLAVGEEVELTIVTHHNHVNGRPRSGVASEYLNRRLQPGDEVGVFLEPNSRFRLPEDRKTPLILIGAGTGIAPFRAFMQQLEEESFSPRSWLIFGNPNVRSDFLYQSEWLAWRAGGLLDRIDTAFSRDQAEKRYVQHVVREKAAEICNWLDWGAHVYICGALSMGHAVEAALREGIASHLKTGDQESGEYLSMLRREKRLKKDLY